MGHRDQHEPSEVHVLVGPTGGLTIRMETGEDWTLDAMRAHHGSALSYRVRRRGGEIEVEGSSLEGSCRFETASPASKWAQLTAGTHTYEVFTEKVALLSLSGGTI